MSTPRPMSRRAPVCAGAARDAAHNADTAREPDHHSAEPIGASAEPSAAQLAEALFRATQALKATGRRCGEEADPALRVISLPRGRVLMALAEAGDERVRMGDLSTALGVTARNITTIVDGLECEGLIARRRDSTDRRAIRLELTRKAQDYIAGVHALHGATAERFFAPLDAGERHELHRLLARVLTWCEEPDDAATAERHDLPDETWARLAPLLPSPKPARGRARGRPARDQRQMVEAIVWIHRNGAPWYDLPERYGPWQPAANLFYRWRASGVWDRVLSELRRAGEVDWEGREDAQT